MLELSSTHEGCSQSFEQLFRAILSLSFPLTAGSLLPIGHLKPRGLSHLPGVPCLLNCLLHPPIKEVHNPLISIEGWSACTIDEKPHCCAVWVVVFQCQHDGMKGCIRILGYSVRKETIVTVGP